MELLTHLFYFLACSALLVMAWLVFLFFNNLIDKQQRKIVQGFLGTVNTVLLITALGIIVYFFALSFFTGVLLTMILIFLIYAGKKTLGDFASTRS